MRLLVDECLASAELLERLRVAGYEVYSAREIVGMGASDEMVLAKALEMRCALLTENCSDFVELYEALPSDPKHSGLLLVYHDGDRRRDMQKSEIITALGNICERFGSLDGGIIALNHHR